MKYKLKKGYVYNVFFYFMYIIFEEFKFYYDECLINCIFQLWLGYEQG